MCQILKDLVSERDDRTGDVEYQKRRLPLFVLAVVLAAMPFWGRIRLRSSR